MKTQHNARRRARMAFAAAAAIVGLATVATPPASAALVHQIDDDTVSLTSGAVDFSGQATHDLVDGTVQTIINGTVAMAFGSANDCGFVRFTFTYSSGAATISNSAQKCATGSTSSSIAQVTSAANRNVVSFVATTIRKADPTSSEQVQETKTLFVGDSPDSQGLAGSTRRLDADTHTITVGGVTVFSAAKPTSESASNFGNSYSVVGADVGGQLRGTLTWSDKMKGSRARVVVKYIFQNSSSCPVQILTSPEVERDEVVTRSVVIPSSRSGCDVIKTETFVESLSSARNFGQQGNLVATQFGDISSVE